MSLDEGGEWQRFLNGLPVVRIDDVVVHPRDNDLVLATHGRSVYVMDDISALQATRPEVMASNAHLYEPREAVQWRPDRRRSRSVTGNKPWTGESAAVGSAISYWLADEQDDVSRTISDAVTGETVRTLEGTGVAGMNRVQWDLRGGQGPAADPGVYRVRLSVDGDEDVTTVRVLEDVWLGR